MNSGKMFGTSVQPMSLAMKFSIDSETESQESLNPKMPSVPFVIEELAAKIRIASEAAIVAIAK